MNGKGLSLPLFLIAAVMLLGIISVGCEVEDPDNETGASTTTTAAVEETTTSSTVPEISTTTEPVSTPTTTTAISEDNDTSYGLDSSLTRDTDPEVAEGALDELVAGNTAFALDLYHAIRQSPENIFLSPYSVSIALAMTYAGARNETETQMADTLHFTLSQEQLHPSFNALDLELSGRGTNTDEDEFRLYISNALWGQEGYRFLLSFLDTLALNYGSGLRTIDFSGDPESSRQEINQWVSDETEGLIEDLLPAGSISELTRLVLTNTIYFKADWLSKFKESDTYDEPFYVDADTKVTVPMMHQDSRFPYTEVLEKYQALELPYQGEEISMVIMLPAEDSLSEFEAVLSTENLTSILDNMSDTRVRLALPKFSFEWAGSLRESLTVLGMIDAFSSTADFTGITQARELFLSAVEHKAFVAVDEEGTEAAAATAVVGVGSGAPGEISMTVDRPFLFLIQDKPTKTILFLGRVLDPRG